MVKDPRAARAAVVRAAGCDREARIQGSPAATLKLIAVNRDERIRGYRNHWLLINANIVGRGGGNGQDQRRRIQRSDPRMLKVLFHPAQDIVKQTSCVLALLQRLRRRLGRLWNGDGASSRLSKLKRNWHGDDEQH